MRAVDERRDDLPEPEHAADADASEITIYIDRSAFRVPRHAMTGHALQMPAGLLFLSPVQAPWPRTITEGAIVTRGGSF